MGRKSKSQNNIVLWVLLSVLLVCFISIAFLFYKYFYAGTSSTKYGDRLEEIEKYPLSDTLEEDIKSLYTETTSINKIAVKTQGRIIYITLDFKESIKVTEAQDLAIKSLEKIGEENLSYYDVQFLLSYSGEEENENFPVFGSKSATSLKVVWWGYEK